MDMKEKNMRNRQPAMNASKARETKLRQQSKRKKTRHNSHWLLRAFVAASFLVIVYFAIQIVNLTRSDREGSVVVNPTVSDTKESEQFSGNQAETEGEWNLLLVNQWNPLPENYEVNLVEVPGGEKVDQRIYDSLMKMLEDGKEGNAGEMPIVVSGFRTQEKQQELYDEKIREYKNQGYSQEEAEGLAQEWVSVPGYSEHQLGFAVDINGAVWDVYQWLQDNSYKYGFIFRYPADKTELTGVSEEVWHYRYVGVEAATKIHEQGICLEEYLESIRGRETALFFCAGKL